MTTNEDQPYFQAEAGLLDRRVYSDPDVYVRELEQVFGRCWLFLGPEDWVREPGNLIATSMGDAPVILWRGLDAQLRAFLNVCPASERKVTVAEHGRFETLDCSCHGLTFGADGVALQDARFQLAQAPRVDVYKGLVFACWDPEAPDLLAYLGDIAWYLDTLLDRREGGAEPIGGLMKCNVETNWKLPVDAFAGDVYREPVSHASLAIFPSSFIATLGVDQGFQISAGAGSLAALWEVDPDDQRGPRLAAYEAEHRAEFEARLGHVRAVQLRPQVGFVFPNLCIHWRTGSLHVWHPRGPLKSEVWTYCFADRAAPIEVQTDLRRQCQLYFGPAGIESQDDAAIWSSIAKNAAGTIAVRHPLNLQMGLGHERYHEDLPGRVSNVLSEMNQRAFYATWQRLLKDDGTAANVHLEAPE